MALFERESVAPSFEGVDDSDTSDIPAALMKQLVESARAQAAQAEAARAAEDDRSGGSRVASKKKARAAAQAAKTARAAGA